MTYKKAHHWAFEIANVGRLGNQAGHENEKAHHQAQKHVESNRALLRPPHLAQISLT